MGVLAFAVAVGTLQMTAMVPMLPVLQQRLHTPLTSVSWTLTAALLSGAVSIPCCRASATCTADIPWHWWRSPCWWPGRCSAPWPPRFPFSSLGRVLQGMAAPLLPLAMGIARQSVPRDRLPTAIGVLSAMMGVGSGAGMILAGLVGGTYQALFWILAGLGAAAFALVAVVVREPARSSPGGRPDLVGAALVAAWLICLLLAISKGTAWGWTSPGTLGLLGAAVALAAVWVVTARRTASPLIEIPMLLHRGTVGATVASMLLGFALFAAITTLSSVAQQVLGASVLQVGLYLLPTALLMLMVSLSAGRLMRRFSSSSMVGTGSLLVAAATLWLSLSHGGSADLYGAAAVLGVGIGLGYAALGTMSVEHVEPAKTAAAGGVNALVRVVGSSLAGAVTAALLSGSGPGWSFAASAVAALVSAVFGYAHGAPPASPMY
ncbi:MFS transporter [Streptosporangium lutulentum]